jgi:hypothetical protein
LGGGVLQRRDCQNNAGGAGGQRTDFHGILPDRFAAL